MNIANELNEIIKEYNSGKKETAYIKFKKIFLENKENTKLRFNLAVMQAELSLISEAKNNYKFLINNHSHLKSKINLYNIYLKEKQFEKSLKLINEILNEDSSNNLYKIDKAFVLYKLNKFEESISECKSILINNNNSEALNIWGLCCFATENFKNANSLFLQALDLDKENIVYLNSLGRLNHEIRESKLAEKYFLKALDLNSNAFQTLNNLAGFYLEEGKYTKAINYYKKSLLLDPNNNIILNNLAKANFSLNNLDIAEKLVRDAISNEKNNEDFKKTLSLILLRKCDFKNAWKYFDGRLGLSNFSSMNQSFKTVKEKLLLNSEIKKNSNLLVIREQGVGDEILYASMYPDLLNKFDNLKIECDERLLKIYQNSFDQKYVDKFIKLGNISNNLEKLKEIDYTIYAGSLGKFFRNDLKSFPVKPYFKKIENYKDDELEKILKNNSKIKIGLSWKSFKNRYAKEKSLELEDFNNFFKLENCSFFNLQYGDIEEELNNFIKEKSVAITTLKNLDLFNNLIGLANLLSNLDFLITVSNSTAHLAGALGVKTLLIKPVNHASYHYWNFPSNQTPWYQSIKIINKKELNNYDFIKKYILN